MEIINAKKRLYGAELLPRIDVDKLTSTWNTKYLSRETYERYKNAATDKVLTINGHDIFCVKDGNYDIYFSLDKDEPYLNFYSQVGIVKGRRNLFVNGIGHYQSAVWRRRFWHSRGEDFISKFLYSLSQLSKVKVLVTDMMQTDYGMAMWINFLSYALEKGLSCYYGLSAPSDKKCVIEIKNQYDIVQYYDKKIVHTGAAYSYRCAFVLHKGQNLGEIITPDTPVLTVEEALKDNLFRKPRRLREYEVEQRDSEY